MPAADPVVPPAGGVPNPGAFDAIAFEAKLMGTFNTALSGFAASLKKDVAKMLEKPADPPPVDPNAPPVDPEPKDARNLTEMNLRVAQYEKKLQELEAKAQAADKKTVEAEARTLEEKRINAFQSVVSDIDWANPESRQIFTDAYLPKIKYAEDGSFIADTPTGPIGHELFLKTAAENMPNLLARQTTGGAGATAGRRPGGAARLDILGMSTEQIMALSPADKNRAMTENLAVTMAR